MIKFIQSLDSVPAVNENFQSKKVQILKSQKSGPVETGPTRTGGYVPGKEIDLIGI